jgi:hypothetical protein
MKRLQDIFLDIIKNPDVPKNYRDLRLYYLSAKLQDEADAVAHLLERRFKENEEPTDGPHTD